MTQANQDNETKHPTPELVISKLPFDSQSGPGYQWHLQIGGKLIAKSAETYPDNWTACEAAGEVATAIMQTMSRSYVALARQVAAVQEHAARELDAAKAKAKAAAEDLSAYDEADPGRCAAEEGGE